MGIRREVRSKQVSVLGSDRCIQTSMFMTETLDESEEMTQ